MVKVWFFFVRVKRHVFFGFLGLFEVVDKFSRREVVLVDNLFCGLDDGALELGQVELGVLVE